MQFNHRPVHHLGLPLYLRIPALALLWFVLISWLHFYLNGDSGRQRLAYLGYMPVITNLAAPLLDHATRDAEDLRFKAIKFSSFAEMAEALRNDQIQAAFMIAPLSIVLRQQGEGVRVVYIGNRHESTFVTRKDLNIQNLEDLTGRTIAVPMRYSGHNLSILNLLDQNRLFGRVKVVEMNPPDMAAALAAGALDGYCVGEPFAAQTLKSGDAKLFHHIETVWPGFICNLVVVKQSLIDSDPELVRTLVHGAARSGMWASGHLAEAAKIVSGYWNQKSSLVSYALSTPPGRIVFDRFVPIEQELQEIADLMVKFGLTPSNDIKGLVDDSFARDIEPRPVNDLHDIFN